MSLEYKPNKTFVFSLKAPSDSPTNVRGESKDSTSLEISWDPPPLEHRNGIITDYMIKYKAKGGQNQFVNVDGAKTSFVIHSLKKFTRYFVWIRANTKIGRGPFTDKKTFSTAEDGKQELYILFVIQVTKQRKTNILNLLKNAIRGE